MCRRLLGSTFVRKLMLLETLILLISTVSILSSTGVVYPTEYLINAVYGSTPILDGMIDFVEWNDAFVFSFDNTTVYLKQDGKNLYFGIDLTYATPSQDKDASAFIIDVNNDKGSTLQTDDVGFIVYRNGTPFEKSNDYPISSPTGGWSAS